MKKFLKWAGIIVGGLVIVLILLVVIVFISHDRFQLRYDSGGELDVLQASIDIISYDLALEIFPDEQAIGGVVTIMLKSLTNDLNRIELDLIDNFEVTEVRSAEAQILNFKHDDGKLMIDWPGILPLNVPVRIMVAYHGQPLEAVYSPWIGGFNWSSDSSGAHWIGLACQGEGADIWFPCKDHPSDKPDSVMLHITVPEDYYCTSNGLLRYTTEPRSGYLTYHWTTNYPIGNYNINISIGKYEIREKSYQTAFGTEMPVRYYVLPQAREGAGELLDMAVDMLQTYRKFYGEYPFYREKFAIVQTDYLGMEHQTINAYGNNYQYRKIDDLTFDQLMLHEMGHEWWGNKVTAGDFADMWIQEGICTYGEALYIEDKLGIEAYHTYMKNIRRRISNDRPIVPGKHASDNEVYQPDIYSKGAQLMHSLRFMLGDEKFFVLLKTFATDSAYTYKNLVSSEDFIQLVERISGKTHRPFIEMFLYTTVLPIVTIDSLSVNVFKLAISNIDFTLPIEIALGDSVIRTELDQNGLDFTSLVWPVVDPHHWYLLTTIESEK